MRNWYQILNFVYRSRGFDLYRVVNGLPIVVVEVLGIIATIMESVSWCDSRSRGRDVVSRRGSKELCFSSGCRRRCEFAISRYVLFLYRIVVFVVVIVVIMSCRRGWPVQIEDNSKKFEISREMSKYATAYTRSPLPCWHKLWGAVSARKECVSRNMC